MKHIISLIILFSLLSGCSTISAGRSMTGSFLETPENLFNGVYRGEGFRMNVFGNTEFTFKATLKAYSENGAFYMQERITDDAGMTRQFTYRFMKKDTGYSCVDIENLKSCSLESAGNSIVLKTWLLSKYRDEDYDVRLESIYQFFPGGKLIKRSSINRFLSFFDGDEVTSYQKEL